jgi:hypothetical protein
MPADQDPEAALSQDITAIAPLSVTTSVVEH